MLTKNWRPERARELLLMLEHKYPSLIHPWNPATEGDEIDAGALIHDITQMFENQSKKLYAMRWYGYASRDFQNAEAINE